MFPLISAGRSEAEEGIGFGASIPWHPLFATPGNAHCPCNTLRFLNAHMRDEKPIRGASCQGFRPLPQRLNPEQITRLRT